DTVCFLFASNEETKEVYPFDFDLIITYKLDGRTLMVKWEVVNTGEEEMYFTIGGHPAFRFAGADEGKSDYILKFPGKESLDYIFVNIAEGAADTSKVYQLELEDGCCPMSEEMFANDALLFDN